MGSKFCLGNRFLAILNKKMCNIIVIICHKRVKNVNYLLNISNFGTLKSMKTCLVIRFFWKILPGPGFLLATHPCLYTFCGLFCYLLSDGICIFGAKYVSV